MVFEGKDKQNFGNEALLNGKMLKKI